MECPYVTDMILLEGKEDIILVVQPYCKHCMGSKLDCIKVIGEISGNEINQLRNLEVRIVKVRCECRCRV
jgi:hypothetical protein